MSARRSAFFLVLAVLTLVRCGGSSDLPAPAPSSVTPGRGFTANATPITIHGDGFSVRTVQPSSGGSPTVDETFQAWLGDQALLNVRRVDGQTLTATVPAGLAPGVKSLRVQGPFGTSGTLASAFTVVGSALASMSAAIAAAPATASVGQSITVTLAVTNTGSSDATGVAPAAPTVAGTGGVGAPTGPEPASIASLAPGASGSFTWIYPTTGAGTLEFSGAATATDSFSGTTVTATTDPALPATATVQLPATLTATLPTSGAAAVGQEFTVAMTVKNTGGAAAKDVVPSAPTVTPPGLAVLKAGTGPVPASVASLAPGDSTSFVWTFVASATAGTATFSSSASGTDANSGAPVASGTVTSGSFTIGAAGISVTSFTATPATASVGQVITLTLVVANPGNAGVTAFTQVASATSTDGASATRVTGPTPATTTLPAGETRTIVWTFQPALGTGVSTGHLTFSVTASGTDAISHGAVAAQSSASSTVQAPAGLAATLTPGRTPPVPIGQPFTVNVGQPFTLSLSVTNTGAAAANGVTPSAIAGCGAPSPASAVIPPGTTPVVFLYSNCSSAAAGALSLSASAAGTDANNPSLPVTSNTASTSVTVQAAAAVTGALSIPTGIARGFPFAVTLTFSNTGGAPAVVTPGALAITAGSTGTATASSGPTPASITVPAGGTAAVQWTYTANTVGSISFTGSAAGIDSNTGTAVPPIVVTPSNAGTIGQGGLSISLGVSSATARIGQVVTFTMTVTNSGTAAVNNVVPTLSLSGGPGTLGPATPASIPSLGTTSPGNTGTFSWTLTTSAAANVTATASATGTDSLSLAQVSASAVVTNILAVQATVGGTLAGLAAGASVTLQNNLGNSLVLAANGAFTFTTPVSSGATYAVTVLTQPSTPSQVCTVTGGTGTIGAANVANVAVNCVTSTFAVGGTVTGLATGASVVLRNNGVVPNLTVVANGAFSFPTQVASGGAYAVTVFTQPISPTQNCVVANGTGTMGATNITNVTVTCTTVTHTVGGTVGGLAGTGLVLQNNGADNLPVSANGNFTFVTPVANGSPYAVTVLSQPTSPTQNCVVANGSGTMGATNITNVTVTCTTNNYTVGGTVTGLTGTGLVLLNNLGDALTVSASGTFTFATPVASGAGYSVTVLTPPTPAQVCTVTNGLGTVGAGPVATVSVGCI